MLVETNPYQVSHKDAARSPAGPSRQLRALTLLWLIAYLAPILSTVGFYSVWIIAWIQLGHMPRPMLDDPADLGGVMDYAYYLTLVSVLCLPAATLFGFGLAFMCPIPTKLTRAKLSALLVGIHLMMCVAAWLLVRYDPGNVFKWLGD